MPADTHWFWPGKVAACYETFIPQHDYQDIGEVTDKDGTWQVSECTVCHAVLRSQMRPIPPEPLLARLRRRLRRRTN